MVAVKTIALLAIALLPLSGCGGSDGAPATAAASSTGAAAPTIAGSPPSSVTSGSPYNFTPVTTDPSGGTLTFNIINMPPWASFSASNGTLSGTPSSGAVGTYSGIVISVSDGQASAALPAFSIQVTASGSTAPMISGSPLTSVAVGTNYSFTPTASGPAGAMLVFAQSNAPSWLTFNSTTGQLSGTPTGADVGTYPNIGISVSDGEQSAALAPFSLTVTLSAIGTASLKWVPPITNTDGTPIKNLAGFKVRFGPDTADMTNVVTISSAQTDNYLVQNLTPATWFFAVTSFNSAGVESSLSNIASKAIP